MSTEPKCPQCGYINAVVENQNVYVCLQCQHGFSVMSEQASAGRPLAISTPEHMWNHFLEYQKDVESKPLYKTLFVGKEGRREKEPLARPLTWAGFDTYLNNKGVIIDTQDYRSNTDGRYEQFKQVVTRINNAMFANKFEGAAAGIFQQNIIARELGLSEKNDHKVQTEQPLFPE